MEITEIPLQRLSVSEAEGKIISPKDVEVPVFYTGKSAYQSYLETTSDNPKLSEEEWAKTKTRIHVVSELPETGNQDEFYAIFE